METKRCGFYIRVSTEMQARVQEGSLKNQRLALEQSIASRNAIDGEVKWEITDYYIDEGKSAKDTKRPEYQRMMADTRDGRINTVLCTALSRISRSVTDSLAMVDEFKRCKIDFICLKENFDTSTSSGKCFFTIMGALNVFEREQVSERMRSSMLARGHRGLSQGCYILGYDLDPSKRGSLIPNQKEARLVNFLYDTYLHTGSVETTAQIANNKGYVSKSYISVKTQRSHGGKKFGFSATLNILTNCAYIGKREVNKLNKGKNQSELLEDQRYFLTDAVWKPIVDIKKFNAVQAQRKRQFVHKNNETKPTKHSYLFNGQILFCEKCGERMEGRNGHGRGNKIYYYYYCVNKDCRHKVSEFELEQTAQAIIRAASLNPLRLRKITDKMNGRLVAQLPYLKEQRRVTAGDLNSLSSEAQKIMDEFLNISGGKVFVEERLSELEKKKTYLNNRLASLDTEIVTLEKKTIDESKVKGLFGAFDEVFRDKIKPYQKRILLQWILNNVRIDNDELKLSIDSRRFRSDIRQVLRGDMVLDTARGS